MFGGIFGDVSFDERDGFCVFSLGDETAGLTDIGALDGIAFLFLTAIRLSFLLSAIPCRSHKLFIDAPTGHRLP